ncbi:hypothetical protein HK100_003672 [Physocladia obscura]|uniref:Proline dehydrogenase n=1 Tax=Physocladia obscura TaxID=109957 RepID=A0AAD5XEF8_9FUNG|nr:hypothetical protein HK100_003672 [Physocladia obscura]
MSKLKNRNMGSILDLAIEADMESEAEPTTTKAKETSSHILSLMKESVDIASENPGSFIAAKVTAYVPPAILLRWTNSLRLVQESFNAVKDATTQKTTRSALAQALSKVFPTMTATTHLSGLGATDSSPIDWIDVSNYFSFTNLKIRPAMFQVNSNSTTTNKLLQPITDAADFATLDAVFADLQALMAHADAKNVKVMVDAEQTYFQRAIDDIALTLSRTFNKKNNVVVFNTYQMYLKDGFQRLVTDWTRAHSRGDGNDGWSFGVKIVRGAYMTSERDRAKQLGYADPINATIADTHASYNAAIDFLLQRLAAAAAATANGDGGSEQKLEFVVASHNKASVAKTVAAMQKYGVAPGNPQISFAQLMGMQDGTSYALAANGYRCFKYVPYGPIEDTIPYLLRRAQENSSVLSGGAVEEDKKELVAEISRRAAASC